MTHDLYSPLCNQTAAPTASGWRRLGCGLLTLWMLLWAHSEPAVAQYLRIRDICRVKGQEENRLHGLGLVVGLNGTGDGDTPTIRALAKMMELMGSPVGQDTGGQMRLDELKNAKNVALVFVTATVPAEGARQGDRLQCEVSAVSAKSLQGGYLMLTPLRGPRPDNPRVYAFAQGPVELDQQGPATVGKIHQGCLLEENFQNAFQLNGKITLVLDKNHASFHTAKEIEELLNDYKVTGFSAENTDGTPVAHAKAIDQVNIEVRIPDVYLEANDIVGFVAGVLDTQIVPPRHDARVVVDKRNGVIIVGENVMVGRVAVSHKNISLQTGNAAAEGPLLVVDQMQDTSTTRLKALVDALNALKVETNDVIHIIENLEQSGDLYGRLIVR